MGKVYGGEESSAADGSRSWGASPSRPLPSVADAVSLAAVTRAHSEDEVKCANVFFRHANKNVSLAYKQMCLFGMQAHLSVGHTNKYVWLVCKQMCLCGLQTNVVAWHTKYCVVF